MQPRGRWAIVAAATALLVALPFGARLLPGGDSTIGARTLLERIRTSAAVPYSGFVQTSSTLAVPVTSDVFSGLGDLFGDTQQLRVWWRGAQDWRVDSITLTGETDLHQDAGGLWQWDYESDSATRTTATTQPQLRLPRADDLLPTTLARRLLSEAPASAVTRLPGRRIAGEPTAGLRVDVADARSTIDHIDVWALPDDGLPVRVEVYASGPQPIVSTTFLDLTASRPDASVTAFSPPAGASLRSGAYTDVVAAIDRLGRSDPPETVAGLPRRQDLALGSVGAYGRGATLLVAVPLNARLAGVVVPELRRAPGVVEDDTGIAVGVGPLNLQLSPPTGFGARWLLVGTVTAATLRDAVPDLPPARGFGFDR